MNNQRSTITHDSLLYDMFDDNEKAVADILLQLPRLMLDQNLTSRFPPWGYKKRRSDINVPSSLPPPPPLQSIPEEHNIPKEEEPIEVKAEPLVPEANIPCSSQPKRPTKIKLILPKPKLPPCSLQIKTEPPNPEATPCFTDGLLGIKALNPNKKASQEKVLAELTDKKKDNLTESHGKRLVTIKAEPTSPKAEPSRFTSAESNPLKPKRKTCKTKEELENKVAELTESRDNLVKCIRAVKKHLEDLKADNLKLKAYKKQLEIKAKSDLGRDTNIGPGVKEPTGQPLSHQQIPITTHQSQFVVNQMAYEPETFGKFQFPYGQTPPFLGFNNDMSMGEGLRPFGDTKISLSSRRTLGASSTK